MLTTFKIHHTSLTEEMEVPLIMIAKKRLYIFNVMYYANI